MKERSGIGLGLALALLAVSETGCAFVNNGLQSCRHFSVDLINRPPGGPAIHLTVEDERISDANLVQGAGVRRVDVCLARGDKQTFKAIRPDGEVLGVATCVVSLDPSQFEVERARVVWQPSGLICDRF